MALLKRNELVIQQIFSDIIQNKKGSSGKLPSAQDLAREYKISTASVREALRFLESIGVVSMSHGRGILVENPKNILPELLQTRIVIECSNAREAAINGTPGDNEELKLLLCKMDEAIKNNFIDNYTSLDLELHLKISALSGNRILNRILENIRLLMHYQLMEVNILPELLKQSHRKHHLLVNAITAKNPDSAEKIIRDHLEQVKSAWTNIQSVSK